MSKIGRNDPCSCGSGKKYKKCCLKNNQASPLSFTRRKMRQTEAELVKEILAYSRKHYHEDLILNAWGDFVLWREIDMFEKEFYPELNEPTPDMIIEFDTLFTPWFLFKWKASKEDIAIELKDLEKQKIEEKLQAREKSALPAKTLAELYLTEKGNSLPEFAKNFISQSINQPFSYFLITHVVVGKQMTIKDLFIDREITVEELSASQTLKSGTIIFARVITIDNTSIFFGMAPYAISQTYHQYFIEYREDILMENKIIDEDLLTDYDDDFRDSYFDIREQLLNPKMPELHNTDGDKLQLIELHYTVECSVIEAFEALKTLSLIPADELRQDGHYDNKEELTAIELSWMEKGNKQHSQWDNTVKANLSLKKEKLVINVNSQQRADQIKRKISRRLGKKASFQNAVYQSTEKLMEGAQQQQSSSQSLPKKLNQMEGNLDLIQQSPEIQEMIAKMQAEHWDNWPDMELPALNNQTPRKASKSKKGRELLESLLLEFQHQAKINPDMAPDLIKLRRELNMD